MVEPRLPKPPRPSGLSRLQALLLLGGALVFGSYAFFRTYRLALDASSAAPQEAEITLSVLRDGDVFFSEPAWTRFSTAVFGEGATPVGAAQNIRPILLYAVRDNDGILRWTSVDRSRLSENQALKPKIRFVRRDVDAIGNLRIAGTTQPVHAFFRPDSVRLVIGRDYRGLTFRPEPFSRGRRLNQPIKEESARLEKPSSVSWGSFPNVFQNHLQRFTPLVEPWQWPGRVELAVSASSTKEVLSPFVLYYKPSVGEKNVAKKVEDFAKNLLSQASPQTLLVQLPDATKMSELRDDPGALHKEETPTRFGTLARYSSRGNLERLAVFYANEGEFWISTDVALIQEALLANVQATPSTDACLQDRGEGFASFSAWKSSEFGAFSTYSVSLKHVVPGLFTLCGYY